MIPDVDLDELERKATHILKTCPFRSITEILNDQLKFLESYRKLKKENEKLRAQLAGLKRD
jgi:cell shape-determining protein MreC